MGQTTLGLLRPFSYGRGYRRSIIATVPAAGANYVHRVPGDKAERLMGITFTLTTSATVANRAVTIDYARANVGTYLQDGAAVVQTAGSAQVYNGSDNRANSEWNTGTAVLFPLWGGILEPGETFGITVASIDTTDALTGIIYTIETYEIGHGGYVIGGVSTDNMGLPDDVMPAG